MAEEIIPKRYYKSRYFFDRISKECSTCREIKPLTQFNRARRTKTGYTSPCKTCQKIYDAQKNQRYTSGGILIPKRKWEPLPKDKGAAIRRATAYRRSLKAQIIAVYGGMCACCGETENGFLTIDHIDGNGHKERAARRNKASGDAFYRYLRARGFPKENYQLLCWNCNCAKSYCGQCPHVVRQQEIAGYVSDHHALFSGPKMISDFRKNIRLSIQ